jgi:hypothetical protein
MGVAELGGRTPVGVSSGAATGGGNLLRITSSNNTPRRQAGARLSGGGSATTLTWSAPGQRLLSDDFDATMGGSLGQQRLDDNLGEASGTEWLNDDLSISLART